MTTYNKVHLSVILACFSSSAFALDPAAVDFEGMEVTPTLEVAGTHDSNYLTTNTAQSSQVINITPAVQITFFGDKSQYQLDYILDHQIYEASNAQNLTSHYAAATADFEFDVRNRLNISAGLNKTEAAANAFTPGQLNAFTETSIGAGYTYGAPSASGNIEVGVNRTTKRSDNGVNLDQENDAMGLSAAFIYRATDKTRLTAEVISTNYDYKSNNALDSQNMAYLLGARWDATAKTTGYAKIGTETKDFKDASKSNTDLTNWELSLDWAPKTYSVVTLTTNQKIDEGSYGADYTNAKSHSLEWNHDWGRGYVSQLSYSNTEKDYSTGRADKTNAYGFGVKYMAKRWMDLGFDYQRTNQDSTDTTYDYDRDIFKLTLNVSL